MIGPNLSEWALSKRSLIVFLMILAVVAGALSFTRLGRSEDPAFTVRTMVVAAGWPGATADETMRQVTERLERTLQETHNVDHVRSYTTAGQTTIFVDVKESAPPGDVAEVWYQVRKNIGDMRHTLPQGVVGPFFNDDFGDTFGTIYGFTADGYSFRELRDYVEAARSKLLGLPDVSKIEILGAQDELIYVEFSAEKLAGLRIDLGSVVAALRAQNIVLPSGTVQTDKERIFLRVSGAFGAEEEIAAVNIVAGDRVVRLGDIATVKRAYADPPQPMFRVNGKPAIGLAISMRDSGDILALGENIHKAMAAITADLPQGIEPFLVADQAANVDIAINEFMVSLWQAIAIILGASFLSLGVRPGTVVALAIPLTLAVVFSVMDALGIDLHRISLGALIIALTLLVDDAMTTVDAMVRRLAAGDTSDQAATFAYRTLAAPMLIGTLVTISSFVPIGFAASSAGEYTFSIFSVVAISLIVSWLVAVIFAPLVGKAILKAPEAGAAEEKPGKVQQLYSSLLRGALRMKWLTIALTLGAFVLALLALPLVPQQFFPASDRPELLVDMTLRQNASIEATQVQVERLETLLAGDKDIDHYSSYVGRGAIRFILTLNAQLANPFFGQFVIVAKDLEARERLEVKLEKLLAEQFPDIISRVSPLELGPPVGWPLQYRVTGPDKEQVRAIALDVAKVIGADQRTRMINYDWMEPARQFRVVINQDEARRLGISTGALSAMLNAAMTGTTVTQVRDGIYLVNVVARATDDQRATLETLSSLQVMAPSGRMVPLRQFTRFVEDQEYPLVWRRDRVPTLTVSADVVGALPDTVVGALAEPMAKLAARLPKGYAIETGGLYEESQASSASVFAVVPMMILLMLVVMMVMLVSFRRLAMVMAVLPLGLIGVVLSLLVFNQPLGFVAILGILALIGMIAKNAVILIVQIETDRGEGKCIYDAVVDSATGRLRPMMLTAISTVLGLIPIAPTVFWGPMAFAIMGGLLVATLLTLVFLPVVYVLVFRDPAAAQGQTEGAA